MASPKEKAHVHAAKPFLGGTFFGGVGGAGQPGTWQGTLDPTTKQNWDAMKAQQSGVESIDTSFNRENYQQTPIQKIRIERENAEQALRQRYQNTAAGQYVDRGLSRAGARVRQAGMQLRKDGKTKRANAAQYAATRVKVTAANAWINSWVMFWYLAFQLPMAVISAAGLGMAYAVYEILDKISLGFLPSGDKIFTYGEQTLSAVSKVVAGALALFGINFDPILLFITPFALVFLFGLFQLILCWFVYALLGIKSLSGQAGGIKVVMFIVAAFGIMIPILNLFPLILLWTGAVWLKPK